MSSSNKLLIFLIGFYYLLFFAFNVKSYILIFLFAAIIIFFFFKKNLSGTVFLLLAMSLPFENNLREWIFQITDPLYIGVPTSGYIYFFGVSLKLLFGLFLFLLLIRKKKIFYSFFASDWSLILFFAIACINTSFFFSTTSILGLIRLWLSILIYFSAKIFFKSEPRLFPLIVTAIFVFSVTIGLYQLVRQKPLGKFLELTPSHSQDNGYSTTDGQIQYRVSGYISHPVYFGSFMSILLPIFITFTFGYGLPLAWPLTLAGITVILGTQSRSAWITLLLSVLLLYPQIKSRFAISRQKVLPMILMSLCLSAVIILTRLQSVFQIFSENGNGSIRLELIWQSLIMLTKHPLGVGLNQFTAHLIDQPLPPNLNGFIVPVHNTIMLIITELGIPAGALFIYFVIKSVFFRIHTLPRNTVRFSAIIGAITFIISSQFHPLLNLDPTFDLFMLTLGYINSTCQTAKI